MKRLGFLLVLGLIIFAGCSREKRITLVLEYQPVKSAICRECEKCGVKDEDVRKAYAILKDRLAEKGFDIQIVEQEPQHDILHNACGMKVSDVPLEVWLDARTESVPCPGAAEKGNPDGMRKTFYANGQSYQVVPCDLMVQAGLMAAQHMTENGGKVDPSKLKSASGCGGCPSRAKCGVE